jgi:hypothetical protein
VKAASRRLLPGRELGHKKAQKAQGGSSKVLESKIPAPEPTGPRDVGILECEGRMNRERTQRTQKKEKREGGMLLTTNYSNVHEYGKGGVELKLESIYFHDLHDLHGEIDFPLRLSGSAGE